MKITVVYVALVGCALCQWDAALNHVTLKVHNNSPSPIDVTGKGGSGNIGWESHYLNNDNNILPGESKDIPTWQSGGTILNTYHQGFVVYGNNFTFYGVMEMKVKPVKDNEVYVWQCTRGIGSCNRSEKKGNGFYANSNGADVPLEVNSHHGLIFG
eukprot:Nk52_evm5s234 gene=Nk52_evmTU5s234